MTLYEKALDFAAKAHAGQIRQYGPAEPYIEHVKRVADMVTVTGAPENVVIASLLHDIVEDTDVPISKVADEFGTDVAVMVAALTNVPATPGLNRAQRHTMNVMRLAAADANVATIKCADIADNCKTIVEHAKPDFARLYLREKADLLEHALTKADPVLYAKAVKTWADAMTKLNAGDS